MEQTITTSPIRYCLYARKSSEADEKQALSIDSQITEMLRMADRDGLTVVEVRKEAHSAKASGQRPVYNQLINDIRSGMFNGIITWAPDRLSRNAGDLGALVDLMDQQILQEIRTFTQKFGNNPNEKFLLMILGSQAKLENDNRGLNVKRGLRTKVEMGLWPGTAPTGYLNEKSVDKRCHVLVDTVRAPVIRKMFEHVANDGWSGRKIYLWLKDEMKFTTKNGKLLSVGNIYLILRNTFYYGMYEYPRGGGNWYTGKHTPIISKELFDITQAQIISKGNKGRSQLKEFAFTRLMTCGLCQSGITADEKFKKLKDGTVTRYVYYGCTRSKDKNCKCGFINEDTLLKQILNLVDELSLDELGMKEKVAREIDRYQKFRSSVLGITEENNQQTETDMKNYAKYILREGQVFEKRELLSDLKSKIQLTKKEIRLNV